MSCEKLKMKSSRKLGWAGLQHRLLWIAALGMGIGMGMSMSIAAAQAAEISGIVYPLHDLTISSGVGGVVLSRQVTLGQSVRAAQVLLVLDDRQQVIEAKKRDVIRQDRSQITAAGQRTAILRELLDQATRVYDGTGAISKDELLHMRADYVAEQARGDQLAAEKEREIAEHQTAELELKLRSIVAPTGGTVTKIHLEPGEWAKPGDPLIHLVDSNTCYLKIALTVRDAARIQVGQSTLIKFYGASAALNQTGRYSFVSPAADPASGLIEARVVFDNSKTKIRPGIKASVEVN